MRHNLLYLAITIAAAGTASDALAGKSKSGHSFRGSVEVQYRSNTNVSAAPGSGSAFDYAEGDEFGLEDDEEIEGDEDDEDDEDGEDGEDEGDDFDDDDFDDGDYDDAFDDLGDYDLDEDEIERHDELDEDGDGIDDLLDPDVDNVVDEEHRYTVKVALTHRYTFEDPSWSWNNAVRFTNDTHQQRDDLDKFNYAVTTGFGYAPKGSKHRVNTALSYVTLEKDNSKFVSTFLVSLAYYYKVNKYLVLGAAYNYQNKDITKPGSPDATVDTLALSADINMSDNDILRLKYAPKVEDSTQVTRDTDAWGYEIAYTRKLPWQMTAGLGFRFDAVDHKNLMPRREDDNDTWSFELTKTFNKSILMRVGYEIRDKVSNIANKDTENESYYIGIQYKF